MRVLYIHQYFLTPKHAGGTRSWTLSHLLQEKGHQVTVISGAVDYQTGNWLNDSHRMGITRESVDGIAVYRVGVRFPFYHHPVSRLLSFVFFMLGANLLALWLPKPDVVFATSAPITVAIPALLLHWLKSVPIVFEARDLWPDFLIQYGGLKNRLLIKMAFFLERLIYQYSKAIVTVSPWMESRIEEKGVDSEKIFCVPIGADVTEFHPNLVSERNVRAELGLAKDGLLVVYAGTHGVPNALDTLIESAGLLGESCAHFLLVGNGRLKPELQKQAEDLGVGNRVHFWPSCSRKELAPILANADLCVITARGIDVAAAIFPNKLFDYLASGKAVLVNFPGVTAELLVGSGMGLAVLPENPKVLADAILDLCSNRPLLHRFGIEARRIAEERFDRRILYQSLVEIIENVAPIKDRRESL